MVCLPHDPRRERFDREASMLHDLVRAGDIDAIAAVAAVSGVADDAAARGPTDIEEPPPAEAAFGAMPDPETFSLDDARAVVARRYEFADWARLSAYLDLLDVYRRDNLPDAPVDGIADEFCRAATLTYTDDAPERLGSARALLTAHPELTHDHIWAAAAAADVAAVTRLLAADPALANREGGPHRWSPLCYLTYSRHDPDVTEHDVTEVARLLLDAGADPNAGYLWGGMPTPFTALTGVFGEGEQGAGRTSRHPHEAALARVLLDAGADPNDGQTLYNRMFRPDDGHLRILFAYGLGRGTGGPWRARLAEALESPTEMLAQQLRWAVERGFSDRVRLLVEHDVDVDVRFDDGRTAADIAAANGDRASLTALIAAGATVPQLAPLDAFVADLLAGDTVAAERASADMLARALAAHPGLVSRAADVNRVEAVPLLASLGFDVNAKHDGQTALHTAAWNGDIAAARLLLAAGADPTVLDDRFDSSPLGWAEHANHPEMVAFLAAVTQ